MVIGIGRSGSAGGNLVFNSGWSGNERDQPTMPTSSLRDLSNLNSLDIGSEDEVMLRPIVVWGAAGMNWPLEETIRFLLLLELSSGFK